ncbi:MAG: type II toxin-antitoxin system VapC family toxin [Anaerolineae bacterium]|nr:type II toxin-antitoxin system VapC family toxin [Anaerolineae bacterium]
MSLYFLDSSALVKRYVAETGSAWIQALAEPTAGHTLFIARITWIEVLSALARRQREAGAPPQDISSTISQFRYDLDTQYQVIELGQALVELAGELALRHPLRTYDAVQLAAACRVQSGLVPAGAPALTFVSADVRLLAVTQTEGLPTGNPNDHP